MDNLTTNLVFLDLETTGLSATQDRIIEIAMLPVNCNLELLDQGWSCVVDPARFDLSTLNPTVQAMHTENGLLDELKNEAGIPLHEAAMAAVKYAQKFVIRGQSPLAGSTIHFDRGFLNRYMPVVDKFFHYRNADVSSLKEFWKRWYPEAGEPPKVKAHRALADCFASVAEAKWYHEHLQYTGA